MPIIDRGTYNLRTFVELVAPGDTIRVGGRVYWGAVNGYVQITGIATHLRASAPDNVVVAVIIPEEKQTRTPIDHAADCRSRRVAKTGCTCGAAVRRRRVRRATTRGGSA